MIFFKQFNNIQFIIIYFILINSRLIVQAHMRISQLVAIILIRYTKQISCFSRLLNIYFILNENNMIIKQI
jgi:hypothetical protein